MWLRVRRPLRVIGIPVGVTLVVVVFGVDRHLIDHIWFRAGLVVVGALAILLAAEEADRE
jgi:hypothetical protein